MSSISVERISRRSRNLASLANRLGVTRVKVYRAMTEKSLRERYLERGGIGEHIVILHVAMILRDLDLSMDTQTLRMRLFDISSIADMDDQTFAKVVDCLRQEEKARRLDQS